MNKLAHMPERKRTDILRKPALAFAMAASLAFPIFAKAEKQSEPMELETKKASVQLKKGEIDYVLDSKSCRLYILTQNSKAIDKIAQDDNQKLEGEAVTLGFVRSSGERQTPFVLTLVRNPKGSFGELGIFKGISAHGKKEVARIAHLKESKVEKELRSLKTPSFLRPGSSTRGLYAAYSRTNPKAAKELLNRAVESYYLGIAIDAHAPPSQSAYFLQTVAHEAIHCLLVTEDFRRGKSIPHGGAEAMAVLGEMAYGQNPWLSLRMLLEGYFPFETGGKWEMPKDLKEMGNYVKFHEVLMRALKDSLRARSVSAIAFRNETQLRKAAESVLNTLSKDFYGAPFAEIFNTGEIKSVLEAAEKRYKLPERP